MSRPEKTTLNLITGEVIVHREVLRLIVKARISGQELCRFVVAEKSQRKTDRNMKFL